MDIKKADSICVPETEWEPYFKGIFNEHCVLFHSTVPTIPDFTKFEEVKKVVAVNEGASIQSLTKVSHIHLFGISFISSFAAGVPRWLKISAISFPFGFLILDVFP